MFSLSVRPLWFVVDSPVGFGVQLLGDAWDPEHPAVGWSRGAAGDVRVLFPVNGFLEAVLAFCPQSFLGWKAVRCGIPALFGLSAQRCLKSK